MLILPLDSIGVIVSGSRSYTNYEDFKTKMDYTLSKIKHRYYISIISGGAKGADTMAKRYAEERQYLFHELCADWKTYGKAAGMIRNKEMLDLALSSFRLCALVAFPSEKSIGTYGMIGIAKEAGVSTKIFTI
jgi:hypothetical protein